MTQPRSRGIPSKESFWLPAIDGPEIKKRGGYENVDWNVDDIVAHVFPPTFQEEYSRVANALVNELGKRGELSGHDLAQFIERNGFSKATVYNKVIPRLRRVGMIKRERAGKNIIVSLSSGFGTYMKQIGSEWERKYNKMKRATS